MIAHQAVAMNFNAKHSNTFGKQTEKHFPMVVMQKYCTMGTSSVHRMVPSAFEFNTQRTAIPALLILSVDDRCLLQANRIVNGRLDPCFKTFTLLIILENHPPSCTSFHGVVESIWKRNSWITWHEIEIREIDSTCQLVTTRYRFLVAFLFYIFSDISFLAEKKQCKICQFIR